MGLIFPRYIYIYIYIDKWHTWICLRREDVNDAAHRVKRIINIYDCNLMEAFLQSFSNSSLSALVPRTEASVPGGRSFDCRSERLLI